MKNLCIGLSMVMLLALTACDDNSKPKTATTETRTMIIGGVPTHERDYRLTAQEHLINTAE